MMKSNIQEKIIMKPHNLIMPCNKKKLKIGKKKLTWNLNQRDKNYKHKLKEEKKNK